MKVLWQLEKVPTNIYTQHPIDTKVSISCLQKKVFNKFDVLVTVHRDKFQ